jgi:hypothetical protein
VQLRLCCESGRRSTGRNVPGSGNSTGHCEGSVGLTAHGKKRRVPVVRFESNAAITGRASDAPGQEETWL